MLELDNLSLKAVVPSDDWYSFPLSAGQSATVGLWSAAGPGISLQLYDAAQNLLAQRCPRPTSRQVIKGFIAPATGTYYVRVSGSGSTYNLFVTRNADFDTEPNDPVAWPGGAGQTLSTGNVLGAVTTSPDWYRLTVAAAGGLSLTTSSQGSGTGQFANAFDPCLELHDASGTLLASAHDNFGGANAAINQVVAAGTYFVEIAASPLVPASQGEYVLSAAVNDTTPPVSRVNALARRQSGTTFTVSVTGSDPAAGYVSSGVVSYDVYVMDNGGPWTLWQTLPAAAPSATFSGQCDHSYGFYSIARDAAGNVEAKVPAVERRGLRPRPHPARHRGDFRQLDHGRLPGKPPGQRCRWQRPGHLPGFRECRWRRGPIDRHGRRRRGGGGRLRRLASLPGDRRRHEPLVPLLQHRRRCRGQRRGGPRRGQPGHRAQRRFAPPARLAVTGFSVEDGLAERSFVRYLDVTFNESAGLGAR